MHQTTAEIITIGDEILYGQIVDTNSQWISAELDKIGVKVVYKTAIGDVEEVILKALTDAENRADIILITGGLGPTNDDLTKPCLATYFDCPIEMNQEALVHVRDLFEKRGFELTEVNQLQAALPTCATMLPNFMGSAPGMWFDKGEKSFISMPGVPYEMKHLMETQVLPRIVKKHHTPAIHHKIIKTIGYGESYLAEKIKDWETNLPGHIKLAYLPSIGQVKLRLTGFGNNKEHLKKQIDAQIDSVLPLISSYVFGYDQETIVSAVGTLLEQNGFTIATAESCTGGFLAHQLTSLPGSSSYFEGAIIAYSNLVKEEQLGVQQETLEDFGAVSEQTVKEMAIGVREKLNTTIGIATSGIAGPGGGTEDKPVGTVWIACADKNGCEAKLLKLGNDRSINIQNTAVKSLDLIRKRILSNLQDVE